MTRISRVSFIAITFTAGFALLSQGAAARTTSTHCSTLSAAQTMKCCARLGNQDTTACREEIIRMKPKPKRQITLFAKQGDGEGGVSGGKGGRGGRGGQK